MKRYSILVFLFTIGIVSAQKKVAAEKYFNDLAYVKSAKLYESVYKKGDTSQLVLERLGDSYYYNSDTKSSEKWYSKLLKTYKKIKPDFYFKYAQSLKSNGKYEEADKVLLQLRKFNVNDSRVLSLLENSDYETEYTNKKERYIEIKNLDINTKYSDYGGSLHNGIFLFSSTRPKSKLKKGRIYKWNNQPYLNIYKANDSVYYDTEGVENSRLLQPSLVEEINTKYHDASAVMTKDGKIIYFTRDNYNGKRLKVDQNRTAHLKLYKAEFKENKWTNITELPFNSKNYSIGQPALSADQKTLYFVSDMPGGYGETDLYKVTILDTNKFTTPKNLGKKINTKGREMFPVVLKDSVLYFSSDGHVGLGGLDIFQSTIKENHKIYQKPENIGAPINSPKDDFSFVVNEEQTRGYFSSNREGGKGDDDLYSFQIKEKEILCEQVVSGIVKDKKLQNPLSGAQVILKQEDGTVINDTIVGQDAKFVYTLPCKQKFIVTASKEYYKPDTATFETTEAAEVALDLDFNLEIADDFEYNERNELVIKIKPIFFDYNKSYIRSDAAKELDLIIAVMKKYPKLVIESGSHTDARGRASYNERLSERRAKSTVQYIIKGGINPNRISGKGYGETQLVNRCSDGVKCSDEEHQANRRTEFVVVKK